MKYNYFKEKIRLKLNFNQSPKFPKGDLFNVLCH